MSAFVVLEPEITNVNVTGFGAGGGSAVGGQMDGTLVILFEYIAGDGVTLSLHEMLDPDSVGKVIASTNSFSFCRAFGIKLLFGGFADEGAAAERNGVTSVAFEIGMNGIGGVNPRA